jgi:hypothetical protein
MRFLKAKKPGYLIGNPALPEIWDPWFSPPALYLVTGGPLPIGGDGVLRLLGVWLCRFIEYLKI